MRSLLLAIALMLPATTVHATTPEAEALTAAMTTIGTIAGQLREGTLTAAQAAAQAMTVRDVAIGSVTDYSDACIPLAVYVHEAANVYALGLLMVSVEDFPMAAGYALVVSAVYAYPATADNRVMDALTTCAGGL